MKSLIIFLDGKKCLANKKMLASLVPGVLDARGVFETMYVLNGCAFALDEHLKRFNRGLKVFGIKNRYNKKKIASQIRELACINKCKKARVRLAVWKDQAKIHSCLVLQKYVPYSREVYEQGFKATLSSIKQNYCYYSSIKSLKYKMLQEAFVLAKKYGFDEAILLNDKGFLVEASRANIFFIKKGKLCLPSIKSGCLNGVTRNFVILLARKLNIPVEIGFFRTKDLLTADEAFLTNSLLDIMPLKFIDQKKIGTNKVEGKTEELRKLFKNFKESLL